MPRPAPSVTLANAPHCMELELKERLASKDLVEADEKDRIHAMNEIITAAAFHLRPEGVADGVCTAVAAAAFYGTIPLLEATLSRELVHLVQGDQRTVGLFLRCAVAAQQLRGVHHDTMAPLSSVTEDEIDAFYATEA